MDWRFEGRCHGPRLRPPRHPLGLKALVAIVQASSVQVIIDAGCLRVPTRSHVGRIGGGCPDRRLPRAATDSGRNRPDPSLARSSATRRSLQPHIEPTPESPSGGPSTPTRCAKMAPIRCSPPWDTQIRSPGGGAVDGGSDEHRQGVLDEGFETLKPLGS